MKCKDCQHKELSIIQHIQKKIHEVEIATRGVVVLQFAKHPEGIAMIVRVYMPNLDKEYTFPDIIKNPSEISNNEREIARVNILFDAIHEALNKLQVVSPEQARKGGIIQ